MGEAHCLQHTSLSESADCAAFIYIVSEHNIAIDIFAKILRSLCVQDLLLLTTTLYSLPMFFTSCCLRPPRTGCSSPSPTCALMLFAVPGSYRFGLERQVISRHGARVRGGAQAARHAGRGGLYAVLRRNCQQAPLRHRVRQGGAYQIARIVRQRYCMSIIIQR